NMDYKEFKDIYIIFITEQVNDRIHLMYVNGQYRGNDELGLLMHDFGCSDYREMKITELKEAVKQLKTGNLEVKNMCEIMEEIRESGRLEGKAEGKLEEKISLAKNLKKMGSKDEFIAKALNCNVDYVKKLLA
ncbi:MAG: hypothetical protein ACI32A_08025, partial [Floccifex sp.]